MSLLFCLAANLYCHVPDLDDDDDDDDNDYELKTINQVPFNLRSHVRKFEVRLGPPGGDKGYKVILMIMIMTTMIMRRM